MIRRGAVYRVDLNPTRGREQQGDWRPCLVVSRDEFQATMRDQLVWVVPLTTTRRGWATHVPVPADARNGLTRDSYALVEQLRAVSGTRLDAAPMGHVDSKVMDAVTEIVARIALP